MGDGKRLFGVGWKDSSSTLTKLLGNRPTTRGSLRNRPIHHSPSPALRASIRSPSMNPRSFLVSPPQEYVALHQQGKRGGNSCGAPILTYTARFGDVVMVALFNRPFTEAAGEWLLCAGCC